MKGKTVDVKQLRELKKAENYGKDTVWAGGNTAPVSGTDYTNNSGYNVNLRIAGGTISAITLDGVAISTPATINWLPMRPGQVVRFTHSGAPTCQWFLA